jgi:endoglucanase
MKSAYVILPVLAAVALTLYSGAALAQEYGTPPAIAGEVVYIPFPVSIALDGDLNDWAGIEAITVDYGPLTSPDPAENGSFTFAVAADMDYFYIYMTMPDRVIITGQHDQEYWNEDSLEFYLNLTGDRDARSYRDGIFQVRIIPGDIGNTDPAAVVLTGIRAESSGAQAIVFETADGWGFEGAVPLAPWGITPTHGLVIGFQAQANGASVRDRNVKLIWSLADPTDRSWQNPSLFGAGVFFQIGQTGVPLPVTPDVRGAEGDQASRRVAVNQVGYLPGARKIAVLSADRAEMRASWSLVAAEGSAVVLSGETSPAQFDEASGDLVMQADFSAFSTPGTYQIIIDGATSVPFIIGADVYSQLRLDAARYFYLSRSGIDLEPTFAGEWARPAGHLSDDSLTCYSGTDADGVAWPGCDYRLDARGGWYDAGDFGKYVVNGGIAVWTLMNLYERFPAAYPDGSLNIPESGNGVPDILDEARWEVEFLLAMQVPEGQPLAGMAHHKLHDLRWGDIPGLPPPMWDNDDPTTGRYLMPPSTAATLNLSAVAAQAARIWREIDPDFAARCLRAAERAWEAAHANPARFLGNTPGEGGGPYNDDDVTDEFYWAAAELYLATGAPAYREYLRGAPYFATFPGLDEDSASAMYWGGTAALGTISLLSAPSDLPQADLTRLADQIIQTADRYVQTLNDEGYPVPIPHWAYWWGSSSMVLNNALIMALAYEFTGDQQYLDGVAQSMDYLLGRNALAFSFITGYGEHAAQHPHHRFWANLPARSYPPPPPGALVGGPNADPVDPPTLHYAILDSGPAKRYVDMVEAYSTNEVAINWNAPLAWVAAFLDARAGR